MPFVADSFTEASDTNLQSHTGETGATWTRHGSYSGLTMSVVAATDRARGGSGGQHLYYASGTPATAEYDVTVDMVPVAAGDTADKGGPAGRIATGANTFYYMEHNAGGAFSTIELFKKVAGVTTSLGSALGSLTYGGASITVKLGIRDATKKAFVGGVEKISSTDNAITAAGKAGLYLVQSTSASNTTSIHYDNFDASDVAGGTDATVTAVAGVTTASATAPAVSTSVNITAVAGVVTASASAPTVSTTGSATITAVAGTVTASASAPVVSAGSTITSTAGVITASASAPTISASGAVTVTVPTAGTVTCSSTAPGVAASASITSVAGVVTASASAPTLDTATHATITVPAAGTVTASSTSPAYTTTVNVVGVAGIVTASSGTHAVNAAGLPVLITLTHKTRVNGNLTHKSRVDSTLTVSPPH